MSEWRDKPSEDDTLLCGDCIYEYAIAILECELIHERERELWYGVIASSRGRKKLCRFAGQGDAFTIYIPPSHLMMLNEKKRPENDMCTS